MSNFLYHPKEGLIRGVSYFFIEKILHHEKCAHFTDDERELVRRAYNTADDLHAKQDRIDKKPYIEHIDRSMKIYLNETLATEELCDSQYLIALILHDCIEDNDIGLISIVEKTFSIETILNVLWMSKPTKRVIAQVMKLKEQFPEFYKVLERKGFIIMYDLINDHMPEKFVDNLSPNERLSEKMSDILKQLWRGTYKKKYSIQNDGHKKHKIYAEFMFLCMIAAMPKELFRIKATERRDNMQDIEGLLIPEKVRSAEGTMFTTMAVYVPRAQEIQDKHLARALILDRNNERARFVEAMLMEPELIGI